MSDTTEEGNGVFVSGMEEYPDVVCQRALAMCRVAEVMYDLGDDGWSVEQTNELRSELLTMLKKLNTSVALPTEQRAKPVLSIV